MAAEIGFVFKKRWSQGVIVEVMGVERKIEILELIPFNSDRKRMTVIVRDQGIIKMLVKGADSIVMERLNTGISQTHLNYILKNLLEFSGAGLRTLCMAVRYLSEQEYNEYSDKILALSSEDRPAKIRTP